MAEPIVIVVVPAVAPVPMLIALVTAVATTPVAIFVVDARADGLIVIVPPEIAAPPSCNVPDVKPAPIAIVPVVVLGYKVVVVADALAELIISATVVPFMVVVLVARPIDTLPA